MYAIVDIAGQQFKVERGRKIFVHRLQANEGADVEFDKVMLIDNGGKITVGSPLVDGSKVAATVISHVKGEKVIVFKKKRRKGYQKWNGHRQQFSEILIQGILGKGEKLTDKLEVKKVEPRIAGIRKTNATETVAEVKEVKAKKTAAPKKAAAVKKAPSAKKTTKKKED
jgi:large subunit ribosomal protein L21